VFYRKSYTYTCQVGCGSEQADCIILGWGLPV